jgi:hypothetical protein
MSAERDSQKYWYEGTLRKTKTFFSSEALRHKDWNADINGNSLIFSVK